MMWLEKYFVYMLVFSTSVVLFAFAVRRLRLDARTLRTVCIEATECVGASVLFLAVNALIGILVIFTIRALRFFPLYVLSDTMLVFLSALQGVLFQGWWRKSQSARDGNNPADSTMKRNPR